MQFGNRKIVTLAVFALVVATALQAQQRRDFHILRTIPLGGDGGWDYLRFDPDSNRLFIARETRVMVVDLAAGRLAAEIPNTLGVHGVALDVARKRGVTSNGKANTASIFDLDSLKVIGSVSTGAKPDGILWEPFTKTVLTLNGAANSVTIIDTGTQQPVSTIALPGRPETAVSDGKGKVFVNLEDKAQIAEIDLAKHTVIQTWNLTGCTEPTGLAIDIAQARLFSGCHNGALIVVDAGSGANIAKAPIGIGVDAVAFDQAIHTIFTSNKEGSVSVVEQEDADTYHNVQTVTTLPGAKTMALDPSRHLVYTVANRLDSSGNPQFVLLEIGP